MSRLPAACFVAVALLLTAACSSSHPASSSATTDTTPATDTTAAAVPTSAAPATTLGPGASRAIGGAPAVGNATNLQAAPTIGSGSGTPPGTLVIRELVIGTGAVAQQGATVNVQYVGANFADGQVFDSSWQRGQPASFSLGGVIPGFAQGIKGMRVGGRRELVIPPALGYGPSGSGPVGANETLVFVVDLLGVQ